MMELPCVLVFTLVSLVLVSATPHGYGTKGGAVAKAEANAGAGAYAGPAWGQPTFPSGAGFSGSYSKSSASSFASSSASSSSSSFSYGGTSAGNLAGGQGYDKAGSNGGCTSGCHNAAPNANSGNGVSENAASNAAANALTISGNGNDCTSNLCGTNPKNSPLSPLGGTVSTSVDNGSNDIPVKILGPGINTSPALDNYNNNNKLPSGSKTPCAYGNCQSTASLGLQPNNGVHGSSDYNPNAHNTIPQNHNTPAISISTPSPYNVPSKHLTLPKQDTSCLPPNCETTNSGSLPSSYNVPIGSYIIPSEGDIPKCTSGNCGNHQINNPVTDAGSSNYLNPGSISNSGIKCVSGDCSSGKSDESSKRPNLHAPLSFESTPPVASQDFPPNCATPQCSGVLSPHYSGSQGPNNQIHGSHGFQPNLNKISYSPTAPTQPVPIPGKEHPSYTGGFGGPSGTLTPNNVHSSAPHSQNEHTIGVVPAQPFQIPNYGQPGHNSFDKPSPSGIPTLPHTSHSEVTKIPSQSHPSDTKELPPYTGGFGGPAGILKPNNFNVPNTPPNLIPSKPIFTTQNKPNLVQQPLLPPTGTSSSTNCGSPNCSGSQTIVPDNTYVNVPKVPSHTHNVSPSQGIISSSSSHSTANAGLLSSTSEPNKHLPLYTGGFGGPPGILNPNDFHIPTNPFVPSSKPIEPTASHTSSCTSPSCSSQSIPSSSLYNSYPIGSELAAGAKANAKGAAYSGGFGAPAGLLKPYDSNTFEGGFPATNLPGKQFPGSQYEIKQNSANGVPLIHGSNSDGKSGSSELSSSGTQANAAAAASAGAIGIRNDFHANAPHKSASGCNSGCGSSNSGHDFSNSFGISNTGTSNGLSDGSNTSGAAAKSLAGAVSGAGSQGGAHGFGGSFASSYASASATSGAATKGGYGRR